MVKFIRILVIGLVFFAIGFIFNMITGVKVFGFYFYILGLLIISAGIGMKLREWVGLSPEPYHR
ncbi:hypothetical protein J4225_04430 [Candidatus Pacearchaeota archaeon]|nr:hypothetical protein [Candidatus Pacearchaeota archaeon]